MQATADSRQTIGVVLLDAFVNPSHEPVGETIPPAATPILRRLACLDLLESGRHLECPGSASIWGDDQVGHNDFLFSPIGKGYHLDRKNFDADLLAQAESLGCELRQGWHLRHARKNDQGYELECSIKTPDTVTATGNQSSKQRHTLLSDFVIDASGMSSVFTRRIGIARNVFDEVISICAFFDLPATNSFPPARTLVQTQKNGWWYATRLPNNKAIVSLCTDAHILKRHKPTIAPAAWRRLSRSSSPGVTC